MKSEIAWTNLSVGGRPVRIVPIAGVAGVDRLPFSLRIVLENLYRQSIEGGTDVSRQVDDLLNRRVGAALSFRPTRIFGQDILGKVMLVDLAALRDALAEAGGDPLLASPRVPVDIIIDHSLQVDVFGSPDAPRINLENEYGRNAERFAFLRWCAESFDKVRVVPPGKGIMHQIHLEKIGQVVWSEPSSEGPLLSPDTCVGTDSHTPMINGLGILGWGVGGIEAEAVMLGKSIGMALPEVIGIRVTGRLRDGVTPTDLVLTITERLRQLGVVGKFVEFFGSGLDVLGVPDRGTIANMAPEYGATVVYFPIDRRTVEYLLATGRAADRVAEIEAYAMVQKLWRDDATPLPEFEAVIEIDLAAVEPCIAGPRNPEDRIALDQAATAFRHHLASLGKPTDRAVPTPVEGKAFGLQDGDIAIAAITSCTNTSNPTSMVAAGLLARNAAGKGLTSRPWVKTSMAPGSHVAAAILEEAGLQRHLDALGFHVVGFGCTTCNGGSGPLAPEISSAIDRGSVVATAVLSGNRNFQGRIHPDVRAAYLASPALVVAYALAGSMLSDLAVDPLGNDRQGRAVHLRDIWPAAAEIEEIVRSAISPTSFAAKYAELFDGGPAWEGLATPGTQRFAWQAGSTYIRRPPYFDGLAHEVPAANDIIGARPLVILGDSVTTDDISPSGAISRGTPSADYLTSLGVAPPDFNNYTTRRGNHEVAVRATFANIRLRNRMVPGVEGGFTRLQPDGEVMRIFEAAEAYRQRGTPLVVIAGENYGCGSSRDWAAKGVALLGVEAVIAGSFERIHRTNLVGMGVLPLQFPAGLDASVLGLDGSELLDIAGLSDGVQVRGTVHGTIRRSDGTAQTIELLVRLDTPEDLDYWANGGILPAVWRDLMRQSRRARTT